MKVICAVIHVCCTSCNYCFPSEHLGFSVNMSYITQTHHLSIIPSLTSENNITQTSKNHVFNISGLFQYKINHQYKRTTNVLDKCSGNSSTATTVSESSS